MTEQFLKLIFQLINYPTNPELSTYSTRTGTTTAMLAKWFENRQLTALEEIIDDEVYYWALEEVDVFKDADEVIWDEREDFFDPEEDLFYNALENLEEIWYSVENF
uniref:Uncharacterized protein n=1 Tax=Caenorhabditis japonica TaxID=281687 RepID=A0A8R1HNX0_CAEJA